jgi:hypothetical protein
MRLSLTRGVCPTNSVMLLAIFITIDLKLVEV